MDEYVTSVELCRFRAASFTFSICIIFFFFLVYFDSFNDSSNSTFLESGVCISALSPLLLRRLVRFIQFCSDDSACVFNETKRLDNPFELLSILDLGRGTVTHRRDYFHSPFPFKFWPTVPGVLFHIPLPVIDHLNIPRAFDPHLMPERVAQVVRIAPI